MAASRLPIQLTVLTCSLLVSLACSEVPEPVPDEDGGGATYSADASTGGPDAGGPLDAGATDGGLTDAGATDGGRTDGGARDGGPGDGGADGGQIDGGSLYDAGTPPADAGLPVAGAPFVTFTNPGNGATFVTPWKFSTSVRVQFSEPMDAGSLNLGTFSVRPLDGGSELPATVAYEPATNTAALYPTNGFVNGGRYTARIPTAVVDSQGEPLAAQYEFSFHTEDRVRPTVADFTPSAADRFVSIGVQPTLTFSEPVNVSTLAAAVRINGAPVDFNFFPFPTTTTATFRPQTPFQHSTSYTVTVSDQVTDRGGLPLVPLSFSFTPPPLPEPISPLLPASAVSSAVAFSPAGDGMTVFDVSSGSRVVSYSTRYRGATQSWDPPVELVGTSTSFDVKLVAGPANQFVVEADGAARIWTDGGWSAPVSVIRDFSIDQSVAFAGAETLLATVGGSGASLTRHDGAAFLTPVPLPGASDVYLSAQGSDFLVAYNEGDKALKSRLLTGATLSAESVITQLQPNDAGGFYMNLYQVKFAKGDGGVSLAWVVNGSATVQVTLNAAVWAGSWSAPQQFQAFPPNSGAPRFVLASDGPTHLVAMYDPPSSSTVSRIYQAGSWQPAQSVGLTEGQVLDAYGGPGGYVLTCSGGGEGVVAGRYRAKAVHRSAGVWGTALDFGLYGNDRPRPPAPVATPNGFLFAYLSGEDAVASESINGTWSQPVALESSSRPARGVSSAARGAGAYLTFVQEGTIHGRPFSLGSAGTEMLLPAAPLFADVRNARMSFLPDGRGVITWEHFLEERFQLQAADFDGGAWSPAWQVDPDGQRAALSNDGRDFLFAYCIDAGVFTRSYAGGVLGARVGVPISPDAGVTGPVAATSNATGWLVAWADGAGVHAVKSADPGSWGQLHDLRGPADVGTLHAASSGDTFGVAWARRSFAAPVAAAHIFFDGGWQPEKVFPDDYGHDFVGGPGGYVYGWGYGTTGQGGRFETWADGGWTLSSFLTGQDSSSDVRVAPEGGGFVGITSGGNSFVMRYQNGAWSGTSPSGVGVRRESVMRSNLSGVAILTGSSTGFGVPGGRPRSMGNLFFAPDGTLSQSLLEPTGSLFNAAFVKTDPANGGVQRLYGMMGL